MLTALFRFFAGSKNLNKQQLVLPEGPFSGLQKLMGYTFKNPALLELALSHRSYAYIQNKDSTLASNERLEFLGDAVLDLVITDHLYKAYPQEREGHLSKLKSLIVSARVLALSAGQWDLGSYILLSHSESRSGGTQRLSIIADAWEAVIGAVYLDGGLEAAAGLIEKAVITQIDTLLKDEGLANYKSQLLEFVQGKGWGGVDYQVLGVEGPEHKKIFRVGVLIQGKMRGQGQGNSKKEAEQAAARDAVSNWMNNAT